jgi:uncharacterized oligopeptide transporter (OPT) family protein
LPWVSEAVSVLVAGIALVIVLIAVPKIPHGLSGGNPRWTLLTVLCLVGSPIGLCLALFAAGTIGVVLRRNRVPTAELADHAADDCVLRAQHCDSRECQWDRISHGATPVGRGRSLLGRVLE